MKYVLLGPCRDEAVHMRRTLDSVSPQSLLPVFRAVIDDASTDETPVILAEYAARLPYLRVIRRDDRGRRSVGPGAIEAFDVGLLSEKCGDETSVGMTKFYRTACFEEIGGFVSEVMRDGIDCHRCRLWYPLFRDDLMASAAMDGPSFRNPSRRRKAS